MISFQITIGFLAEQEYNGLRAKYRGFGVTLDKSTFTPTDLAEAINEVVYNTSYKSNIQKCSDMHKTMRSPQEQASFWVNHVLRFGGSHLKPPGIGLKWYQMFMLDVLLVFVICDIIAVYIFYKLLKFVFRKICIQRKVKGE